MQLSPRWDALKGVNNNGALDLILKNRDKRLDKQCAKGSNLMYDDSIPMIE